MNVIEPNAPPNWYVWAEYLWILVIVLGAVAEAVHFFDPRFPTFTGLIKKWCPWIVVRAAVCGGLFYHFCIQPIVETLNKMGYKIF